ncbi:hypothetical protein BgiBS90_016830 [Biomphalaria glabrata]|nr:hypothetical protein BgiBS90_016830 [Biomphalaria glabrata]
MLNFLTFRCHVVCVFIHNLSPHPTHTPASPALTPSAQYRPCQIPAGWRAQGGEIKIPWLLREKTPDMNRDVSDLSIQYKTDETTRGLPTGTSVKDCFNKLIESGH